MIPSIEQKNVLVTVRTYPTPARKGVEVSCTAGITDERQWVRLFPVPYRRLDASKRFKKYQWVQMSVTKASRDPRPESYVPDLDSIRIVSDVLPTANRWEHRKGIAYPMRSHCLCCIQREQRLNGYPTLGLFKPRTIGRLIIEPEEPEWTAEQLARLRQSEMFVKAPPKELEKIPYTFKYAFRCDHDECPGHILSCTDWEICEAYRRWRKQYGPADWEGKFRETFEYKMIQKYETHFYVGTMHAHPYTWIIVGLFYPTV